MSGTLIIGYIDKKLMNIGWFNMKGRMIVVLMVLVLMLVGCSNQMTGKVVASLDDSSITSGQNTRLVVNAKNTGNTPFSGQFLFVSEKPDFVKLSYANPDALNFTLQPGEDTGNKIVQVYATTDVTRSDFTIKVYIRSPNGETIDTANVVLTVKRE